MSVFYIVADHPTMPGKITRVAIHSSTEEDAMDDAFEMLTSAVVLGSYLPAAGPHSSNGRYLYTYKCRGIFCLGAIPASSAEDACRCIEACLESGNLVVPQEPIA